MIASSGVADGEAETDGEAEAEGEAVAVAVVVAEGDASDVGEALDSELDAELDAPDGAALGTSLEAESTSARAERSGVGIALDDASAFGESDALADSVRLSLAVGVALIVDGELADALDEALTLADALGVGAGSLSTHRAGMPSTRSFVSLAAAG